MLVEADLKAIDLMTILESYDQVLGQDALYGPHQDLLAHHGFDPAVTAAHILGTEVRAMADTRTLDTLLEPFTDSGREFLQTHMIRTYHAVDRSRPFTRAGTLLKVLEQGLRG